jgi:hypothetical protein
MGRTFSVFESAIRLQRDADFTFTDDGLPRCLERLADTHFGPVITKFAAAIQTHHVWAVKG